MQRHPLPINEKIFISIPSYEDELLLDTIKSALEKAEYPDRLTFGVALQYKEIDKPDISFLGDQLKLIEYKVDQRPGIIEIRKEISDLITDEKYFLGIDAHTLFTQNWDSLYIYDHNKLVKQTNNKNICIASRISGSEEDFKKQEYSWYLDTSWVLNIDEVNIYDTWWDWPAVSKTRSSVEPEYVRSHFVSANNWFTTTDFFAQNMFWCFNKTVYEEPQISLSLFLNNYEVYYPTSKVFVVANPRSETTNRKNKTHWKTDLHKNWNHDDITTVREIFKFFYTGKSKIFSLDEPQDIYRWWNAIGLLSEAKLVAGRLNTIMLDRTYHIE